MCHPHGGPDVSVGGRQSPFILAAQRLALVLRQRSAQTRRHRKTQQTALEEAELLGTSVNGQNHPRRAILTLRRRQR